MVKDFGRRVGWPGGKRKDWRGSRHSRESRESHLLRSPYNHNKLNLGVVSRHRRVRRAVEQEGRAREEKAWAAGSSGMEMKSDGIEVAVTSCLGRRCCWNTALCGFSRLHPLRQSEGPLRTASFNRCFYSFRLKIEKRMFPLFPFCSEIDERSWVVERWSNWFIPIAIQSNYLLLDFFNFFNFSNSIFIIRLWLFFEERS